MSDLKSLSVKSMREDMPYTPKEAFGVWLKGIGFTLSWMFPAFVFLMAVNPDASPQLIAMILSPSIVFGWLMMWDAKHTCYTNSIKYLAGSSHLSRRDTYKLDAMLRKRGKSSVPLSDFSDSPDAHKKILIAENKTLTVIESHPVDSIWDNTLDSVLDHYNLSHYRHYRDRDWKMDWDDFED